MPVKITELCPQSGFPKLLWEYVWGPINLVIAFGPLMICNFMQFPSLLLLPFSKKAFRQYNRIVAFLIWGGWAWSVQRLIGLKVIITGENLPNKEDAVVICNHQDMGDILILLCLALQKGRTADLKWIVKDILKYVPGLGWGMVFLECIFIKRRGFGDEARITKTLDRFSKDKVPLWMVLFPEGTRFTKEKQQKSIAYAKRRGRQPNQHLLMPRTKGFTTTVDRLKNHVKAVYSITIGYEGKVPKLTHIIRGDVQRVHCHVRRFPLADLPSETEALSDWLHEEFKIKDQLMDGFYKNCIFA
jgi:1-acyl-sn-glycerol-3-phosphate acyltransferase